MPIKSLNDKLARIQYDKLPLLVSQSYSPVTRNSNNSTDTAWTILYSVVVPAGTMNLNGKLVIEQDWKFTASGSTKQLRMDWGGVWVSGPYITGATLTTAFFDVVIKNKNSLSAQMTIDMGANGYGVNAAGADVASAIDTSQDVTIDFKCSWNANVLSDQIILRGYSIWHYPGNT